MRDKIGVLRRGAFSGGKWFLRRNWIISPLECAKRLGSCSDACLCRPVAFEGTSSLYQRRNTEKTTEFVFVFSKRSKDGMQGKDKKGSKPATTNKRPSTWHRRKRNLIISEEIYCNEGEELPLLHPYFNSRPTTKRISLFSSGEANIREISLRTLGCM